MPDIVMTVKGYFALAEDYEAQAYQWNYLGVQTGSDYEAEYNICMDSAQRCRISAYKLLGETQMTEIQKHMSEWMADF